MHRTKESDGAMCYFPMKNTASMLRKTVVPAGNQEVPDSTVFEVNVCVMQSVEHP